eukprot:GCRY01003725.1.p1 GENE.GCRY01003725.1~~GCRY01003725.1.p1  ORF type:complete len:621 (-),score=103.81 GCRY01003725.1:111-1973(-)
MSEWNESSNPDFTSAAYQTLALVDSEQGRTKLEPDVYFPANTHAVHSHSLERQFLTSHPEMRIGSLPNQQDIGIHVSSTNLHLTPPHEMSVSPHTQIDDLSVPPPTRHTPDTTTSRNEEQQDEDSQNEEQTQLYGLSQASQEQTSFIDQNGEMQSNLHVPVLHSIPSEGNYQTNPSLSMRVSSHPDSLGNDATDSGQVSSSHTRIPPVASTPQPLPVLSSFETRTTPHTRTPKALWCEEEDVVYLEALQQHGFGHWKEIAAVLKERGFTKTNEQVRSHYRKLMGRERVLEETNKRKRESVAYKSDQGDDSKPRKKSRRSSHSKESIIVPPRPGESTASHTVRCNNIAILLNSLCVQLGVNVNPDDASIFSSAAEHWLLMTEGYAQDVVVPDTELRSLGEADYSEAELIAYQNIPFSCICAQHLAPFYGTVTVGYVPDKVAMSQRGLGIYLTQAFARIVNVREACVILCSLLNSHISPRGVIVVARSNAPCCAGQLGMSTHAVSWYACGELSNPDSKHRTEFMSLLSMNLPPQSPLPLVARETHPANSSSPSSSRSPSPHPQHHSLPHSQHSHEQQHLRTSPLLENDRSPVEDADTVRHHHHHHHHCYYYYYYYYDYYYDC